jgi:hypothetical protein
MLLHSNCRSLSLPFRVEGIDTGKCILAYKITYTNKNVCKKVKQPYGLLPFFFEKIAITLSKLARWIHPTIAYSIFRVSFQPYLLILHKEDVTNSFKSLALVQYHITTFKTYIVQAFGQ